MIKCPGTTQPECTNCLRLSKAGTTYYKEFPVWVSRPPIDLGTGRCSEKLPKPVAVNYRANLS
jgi:hypothetical protein